MKRKTIYYTGKPKYVTDRYVSGVDFIGDYIGFKDCEFIANCRIYRSKKIHKLKGQHVCVNYSNDNRGTVAAFYNCTAMSACFVFDESLSQKIKRFLKNKFGLIKVVNKILSLFNLEIVMEYYYDYNVYSICRKLK